MAGDGEIRHPQRCRGLTYFASSTRESVTAGAQSFLTRRMFRGGAGHCRERRSLLLDSGIIDQRCCTSNRTGDIYPPWYRGYKRGDKAPMSLISCRCGEVEKWRAERLRRGNLWKMARFILVERQWRIEITVRTHSCVSVRVEVGLVDRAHISPVQTCFSPLRIVRRCKSRRI